jgi:hypothetical protein
MEVIALRDGIVPYCAIFGFNDVTLTIDEAECGVENTNLGTKVVNSGSWLLMYSKYFPTGLNYHTLDRLELKASAKNMELYSGESENMEERTYATTIKGEKIEVGLAEGEGNETLPVLYRFVITKEHLAQAVSGPGTFMNLYMRLVSLQVKPLFWKNITLVVSTRPDPANIAKPPSVKRSAAARGGAGGVLNVDTSAILGMLANGGGIPTKYMVLEGTGPENQEKDQTAGATVSSGSIKGNLQSIPPSLLSFMANSGALTSASNKGPSSPSPSQSTPLPLLGGALDSIINQFGQLIDKKFDEKLSPIISKLDELCKKVDDLEKGRKDEREGIELS